jgi:hypothetical protein
MALISNVFHIIIDILIYFKLADSRYAFTSASLRRPEAAIISRLEAKDPLIYFVCLEAENFAY